MPGSRYCVFPYCGNSGKKGFFQIPKKEPKRSQWIDICALHNTQLNNYSSICSLHFEKRDLNLSNAPNKINLLPWAKPFAPFHHYIAANEEISNPDIPDNEENLQGREPK